MGVLTVQNYTLGSGFTDCNFVSFNYTSSKTTWNVTQATHQVFSGMLPVSLPATANVIVADSNLTFTSHATPPGSWYVLGFDTGTSSTWSNPAATPAAPTMSIAALCALGLLLASAGALLVRARRTARA